MEVDVDQQVKPVFVPSQDPEVRAAVAALQGHRDFLPALLIKAVTLMNLRFKRGLKAKKMSHSHWTVMTYLARHGDSSLNEVARAAFIDQPSLSRIIDQMVQRDLVIRTPNPDDGRFLSLSLSVHGWERYEELALVAKQHADLLISHMAPADVDTFRKLLQGVCNHLMELHTDR